MHIHINYDTNIVSSLDCFGFYTRSVSLSDTDEDNGSVSQQKGVMRPTALQQRSDVHPAQTQPEENIYQNVTVGLCEIFVKYKFVSAELRFAFGLLFD